LHNLVSFPCVFIWLLYWPSVAGGERVLFFPPTGKVQILERSVALNDHVRWERRPEGSNWGDFGPDDELGRLNLLTPERVRAAVAEVREGRVFCLSLPLDFPGGTAINASRLPPRLSPVMEGDKPNMNFPYSHKNPQHIDVLCDDQVLLTLQYSTQWDSLAHIGQEFDADGDGRNELVFYNGFRAGEDITGPVEYRADGSMMQTGQPTGARRLGVENMARAGMQGRGVMIDFKAHFGEEKVLVGHDALMRVLEADHVSVEEGDIVCVRTGFDEMLLAMDRKPDAARLRGSFAALDGRDPALHDWVRETGLVALVADNIAVEGPPARACPDPRCAALPLHELCLFKLGVYLGEFWHLSELADWLRAHDRNRFLLTAPPLRLPGAVGSPVTPIATV
jgi:kynurenine formamidase